MSYGPPPPGNPGPPPGGYGTGGYGPPAGGYGPPSGGQPGFGGPPSAEPPKNYLIQNILGIISCIPLIGIIGLIFALQVNSKWTAGDYAGAESNANTAKILGIIGLVLFIINVVFWVGYFIFVVVLFGAAGTASYSGY